MNQTKTILASLLFFTSFNQTLGLVEGERDEQSGAFIYPALVNGVDSLALLSHLQLKRARQPWPDSDQYLSIVLSGKMLACDKQLFA